MHVSSLSPVSNPQGQALLLFSFHIREKEITERSSKNTPKVTQLITHVVSCGTQAVGVQGLCSNHWDTTSELFPINLNCFPINFSY